MLNLLIVFISGLIFGLGLIMSGMSNPAKVLGFLDIAGSWDPSLVLVMVSAIAVAWLGFRQAPEMKASYLGLPMRLPTKIHLDTKLIAGSLIFGLGWGLVGICPGPAIVILGFGLNKGIFFVLAMLAGMYLYELVEKLRA